MNLSVNNNQRTWVDEFHSWVYTKTLEKSWYAFLFFWSNGYHKASCDIKNRSIDVMTLNTGGNAPGVFEFKRKGDKVQEMIEKYASKRTGEAESCTFGEMLEGIQLTGLLTNSQWGLSEEERGAFLQFFQDKKDEKAVNYLYGLPDKFFSCEKNLKDYTRVSFNDTYPTLDTLVPLEGDLAKAKKDLLDTLMQKQYDEATANKIQGNEGAIKGAIKEDYPDKNKLEIFTTEKGQLLMYGIFQCMILHQVVSKGGVDINAINQKKEDFKRGFATTAKVKTLANTVFKQAPSVFFTQENLGGFKEKLEERYVCAKGQDEGDGTLVFLDKHRWKDIQTVRTGNIIEYFFKGGGDYSVKTFGNSLKASNLNFVTATHRANGEKFLFVSAHAKSGGSSGPIKAQWDKTLQLYKEKFEKRGYKLIIGADANTEKEKTDGEKKDEKGDQSWSAHFANTTKDLLCPKITSVDHTSAKTRVLTTQLSKQLKPVKDEKDYIISVGLLPKGDENETRCVGGQDLLSESHPTDHCALMRKFWLEGLEEP